jgi:DNA-binding CsgD family transcriptional regulator
MSTQVADWWIEALAAELERLQHELAIGATTHGDVGERLAALRWHADNARAQIGAVEHVRLATLDSELATLEASLDPESRRLRRGPGALTARQRDVLRLIAGGRSMKQAAAALRVSPRTVAFHKYRMMRQLRVRTSAELLLFALRTGLITHQ